MGALDALFDPQFRRDVVRGALDAVNRGAVAGTIGGPVDLLTMALRPLGYTEEKPVMGSEWIGDKLQRLGLVTEKRNPVAEALASVAIPGALSRAAPAVFAAEQRAAQNLMQPSPMNAATRGQAGAIVWHGSPHKFDKFDSSKIGTGEGAQAYGHGLYLAESPNVARSYQNLKPITDPTDGGFIQARAAFDIGKGNVKKSLAWLDDRAAQVQKNAQFLTDKGAGELSQIARAKQLLNDGAFEPGQLYKVDLPDDQIARMLDWDKPLSQQAPEVQAAVSAIKQDLTGPFSADMTGDQLLRHVQATLKGVGRGDTKAEEELFKRGVPGIRYLDQASRNAGQFSITPPSETVSGKWMVKGTDYNSKGFHFDTEAEALDKLREMNAGATSNFVVFPGNEGVLRILERNGMPLGGTGQ